MRYTLACFETHPGYMEVLKYSHQNEAKDLPRPSPNQMETIMKRNTLIISAAVVGLSALIATASFAHGPNGGGFGQGFMNGQGQHGMMGGQGGYMQGQGGHNFTKGFMNGNGFGDCQNVAQTLDTPLTIEDVTKNLTQRLDQRGNDRLKVGNVTETDTTITAEIVTVDDSLVRKIEIDKTTGQHKRMN